jgi:hypothetical protein
MADKTIDTVSMAMEWKKTIALQQKTIELLIAHAELCIHAWDRINGTNEGMSQAISKLQSAVHIAGNRHAPDLAG